MSSIYQVLHGILLAIMNATASDTYMLFVLVPLRTRTRTTTVIWCATHYLKSKQLPIREIFHGYSIVLEIIWILE